MRAEKGGEKMTERRRGRREEGRRKKGRGKRGHRTKWGQSKRSELLCRSPSLCSQATPGSSRKWRMEEMEDGGR